MMIWMRVYHCLCLKNIFNHFLDDIPFDDGPGYDYNLVIQQRLKKANEEFRDDQTSTELKHSQRIAFDPIVKAVDIIQDPNEHDHTMELFNQASMSTLVEESPSTRGLHLSIDDDATHEYTVPLNDTQPKQGPTLLEQLKAMQFYGSPGMTDSWLNGVNHVDENHSSNRINDPDVSNLTTSITSTEQPMIVAINGKFDLQNPTDYLAKNKSPLFLPAPPREPKQGQIPPRRSIHTRPKSSESGKRTTPLVVPLSTSNHSKTETSHKQRPKR